MNAHSARAAPAEILYRWLRASPPLALMLALTLLVAASQQTLIE